MSIYLHTFTVSGPSPFPLDMLRYDGCYPASQEAVSMMHISLNRMAKGDVEVTLSALSSRAKWKPTAGRWNSFGWFVIHDVNHTRLK